MNSFEMHFEIIMYQLFSLCFVRHSVQKIFYVLKSLQENKAIQKNTKKLDKVLRMICKTNTLI
jgi:hypothetical protein